MIPTCCCLRQRPGLALQVLIIQESGYRGSDRQQRGDQQEHLLSTLRALDRRRPVLPTQGPHGCAHRGQGAENSLAVLF